MLQSFLVVEPYTLVVEVEMGNKEHHQATHKEVLLVVPCNYLGEDHQAARKEVDLLEAVHNNLSYWEEVDLEEDSKDPPLFWVQ